MSGKWNESSGERVGDKENHRAKHRKPVTDEFIRHQGSQHAQITSNPLPQLQAGALTTQQA